MILAARHFPDGYIKWTVSWNCIFLHTFRMSWTQTKLSLFIISPWENFSKFLIVCFCLYSSTSTSLRYMATFVCIGILFGRICWIIPLLQSRTGSCVSIVTELRNGWYILINRNLLHSGSIRLSTLPFSCSKLNRLKVSFNRWSWNNFMQYKTTTSVDSWTVSIF